MCRVPGQPVLFNIYKLGQPNIEQSRTMELEYFIQLLDMAGWESLLPSHIGTGLE